MFPPLAAQLIFRKVSDMKREKELAERRKNEPKLDQNQDHLVRKIFSRFRKGGSNSSSNLLSSTSAPSSAHAGAGGGVSNGPCGSQGGTPSHSGSRDVERGDLFQHQLSNEESGGGVGGAVSSKEDTPSSRAGSAKSKWGRMMMRGSSSSMEAAIGDSGGDPQSMQSLLPTNSKSGSGNNPSGGQTSSTNAPKEPRVGSGSGNKVHPKLTRVPERQENLDEPLPPASGRLKAADYQPPPASSPSEMLRAESPVSSGIIESFAELKQEVRNEVNRINHKMSRLEDILGEILVRLTPPAPAAATIPAPSSRPSPSGRGRHTTQVAPAPNPAESPFLVVTSASLVDESSGTTSSSSSSRSRPRGRPKSAGAENKLVLTHFQEYV